MNGKVGMRAFSVLLALLLVSVGVVPAVSATSINTENSDVASVYRVAEFSNPITLSDLKEMRESVIDNSQQRTDNHAPLVLADPVVPEGAEIVAYGFTLDARGVPVQYVGLAGDEESVSIIQKRAQEWYDSNIVNPQLAVAEQAGTLDRAGWIEIGRNTGDYYLSPYGGVTDNYELRQLSNDGDNTKDWFAIKQIFAMEPGRQAFEGSSWTNKKGTMLHDWAAGTFGSPNLYEWDPLGTKTGEQTIGVSITGGTGGASATWSWSYDQPEVTTYDRSSTDTEKAKWEMFFNSDAAKRTTGGMKPGSVGSVSQHSSGTYRILNLQADGQFYNGMTTYHTLSHVWNINFQY
ncbi:hypothetical protein [Methanoculleus sp.]|nr:hypothetical protein [Methanoculleus sp.]